MIEKAMAEKIQQLELKVINLDLEVTKLQRENEELKNNMNMNNREREVEESISWNDLRQNHTWVYALIPLFALSIPILIIISTMFR